jgi:hypothetical protein
LRRVDAVDVKGSGRCRVSNGHVGLSEMLICRAAYGLT